MRFPFAALFAVFFLFLQTVLHAGAWTQKRGHFYTKFGILRFESASQYLLNRDRERLKNNGRVTDFTVYNYLEYGLFEDLTLIANIPAKRAKFSCAVENCDDVSSGLADVIFGMRYKLSDGAWIVSIQSDVKIATNYERDEKKLGNAPPLGDGQTDFDFILLVGRSLFNYRGYINLEAGYRTREGEPVDEVPFSFEMGITLTRHYVLLGRLYGVRSISEDDNQDNFTFVDGKVQNFVGTGALEDYVKAQAQLIYKIHPNIDLSFEVDQVLTGRNTSHATTVGFGMAFHK
ncbi:MAG: hypothetical protein O7G31_03835 [Calditrichaeota bacterium]|nr:hypothetical protein [Calditrichota bacterium]